MRRLLLVLLVMPVLPHQPLQYSFASGLCLAVYLHQHLMRHQCLKRQLVLPLLQTHPEEGIPVALLLLLLLSTANTCG